MRFVQWYRTTSMWSLILVFGVCSPHWTIGTAVTRGNYIINVADSSKILVSVTPVTCVESDSTIDLSSLELKGIENNVFELLTNIKHLNLANNKLERIPSQFFSDSNNLETLSLANNSIHWIRDVNLHGLNNLKRLDLSNNHINLLQNYDLLSLPKSTDIVMEGNDLQSVFVNTWNRRCQLQSQTDPWAGKQWYSSMYLLYYYLNSKVIDSMDYSSYRRVWQDFYSQPFSVKLCETNGVVESVSILPSGESSGNCLDIDVDTESLTLKLHSRGLKKFRRGWYKIPKNYFANLDLRNNDISEITSELLNDLPETVVLVNLRNNRIQKIEKNIVENRFLRVLILKGNEISSIEADAFEKTNIHAIDVSENNLTSMDFVKTLPKSIKELVISNNQISEIPEDVLMNLESLQNLEIRSNRITRLSTNSFRGRNNLRFLDLAENLLETIESGTFVLKKLSVLYLYSNHIRELKDGAFKDLKMIEQILLSNNRIERITRNTFVGLQNLIMQDISLYGNNIDTVEEGSFANMNVQSITLSHNKISENSIAKGAFASCILRDLSLDRNLFQNINGDLFSGITVNGNIYLRDMHIGSIKKGTAQHMSRVQGISLERSQVDRIENGALYGFQKCPYVEISFGGSVKLIQAGAFDNI